MISAVYSLLSESCGEKNEPQTEDGSHERDSEHGVRIINGWNSTGFHFLIIYPLSHLCSLQRENSSLVQCLEDEECGSLKLKQMMSLLEHELNQSNQV